MYRGFVISAIVALVFVSPLRPLGFAGQVQAASSVVINELMWDGTEYIELFNATGAEVSLSGWTITRQKSGDVEKTVVSFKEGEVIGAGEYFLIERKEEATSVAADKIVSGLVLVNTGELVRLKDSSGAVIDSANQLDMWLAGEDTPVGEAMERSDVSADGTLQDSWHTSTGSVGGRVGTPGQVNSAVPVNHAPLAAISASSDEILIGESVTFSAEDSSDEDGDDLTYTWSFGDGSSGPPAGGGSVVAHTYTSAGNKTVSITVSDGELSGDASVVVSVAAATYSNAIVINEFLPDPAGSDTSGEFIELLNTGSVVVDVGGWQVDDADGGSSAYTIPAGTTIAAGGYLSLARAVTKIALNNDGDTVRLLTPDKTVKASFAYGDSSEGQSFNRQGSGYVESTTATPGAVNVITLAATTTAEASEGEAVEYSDDVLINEWLPNPTGSDASGEFIELINLGSTSVSLAGWKLDDEDGGSSAYTIPAGTTMAAGGFLVLGREETKLALNNDGDAVRLLNPAGKVVSTFTYEESMDEGVAWARDSKGAYQLTTTVTKGKANVITQPSPEATAGKAGSVAGTSTKTIALANIRSEEEGTIVTVEGVVSAPPGVLGKGVVYVAGSGVQVYFSDDEYPALAVGDRVKLTGKIGAIAGETRLKLAAASDIAVVKKDAVPLPHEVKTGKVGEAVEGFLVVIVGKVTETSGDTFYVDDGSGAVKVFIKESTGIEKPKMKKGDTVTIIGVVSQTSSGYRILPRFQDDVHIGAVAGLKTFPAAGAANICVPARPDLWMLAAALGMVGVVSLPMWLRRDSV